MICVYKEHEIKTKKVQEQWLQLKIKFSLGYKTWKLSFSAEDGEINLWWVGRREDRNLVGGGSTGGIFPGGGNEQIFSWWEGSAPILPSRKTNIYIYTLVPDYVLITLQTLTQQFFLSPEELKNLISCPRQTKSRDNSNLLLMFNNNTYIDFRTACKHILIPSYFIQVI